jgi:UMF1 family MFS transporter
VTRRPSTPAERGSWYLLDFANSAFYTTGVTVFLGPFLTALAQAGAGEGGMLRLAGIPVDPRSFFPYCVSLSVLLQVFVLPSVGVAADRSGRKKGLLLLSALGGAACACALAFAGDGRYLLGGALFVAANLFFGAASVFTSSYIADLAPPEGRDALSSRGWALGYLGGGILLALNLLLMRERARFGLSEMGAVRWSLLSAGLWWAFFTLPAAFLLRKGTPPQGHAEGGGRPEAEADGWGAQGGKAQPCGTSHGEPRPEPPARPSEPDAAPPAPPGGFRRFLETLADVRRHPATMVFLCAYLLYNDGIQTVITMASQFGRAELGLPMSSLVATILMIQFLGIPGTLLFERVARRTGTRRAVAGGLVAWLAILLYAYFRLTDAFGFFLLGGAIALVLGGTQALSRSAFSRMVPPGKEAEYFGLYEISDKGTSWLGPLLFGLALQFTGSYRVAILSLALFFAAGLFLLLRYEPLFREEERKDAG